MPYVSRKSIGGIYLIIPAMIVMLYSRYLFLSAAQTELIDANLSEVILLGGSLVVIVGVVLFATGIPETRKRRRILEAVLARKEITISEISTQTGLDREDVRKTISNLLISSNLFGFLEDDLLILFPHQTYDGESDSS